MSEPTERHQPVTSACPAMKQYEGSDIEHVCRLDHVGSDAHSCTCGLLWHDTSRDEELERLRIERDELRGAIANAEDYLGGVADGLQGIYGYGASRPVRFVVGRLRDALDAPHTPADTPKEKTRD